MSRLIQQRVNIVYIGTPHVAHYTDAKLVLEGGKHCLLEKVSKSLAGHWPRALTLMLHPYLRPLVCAGAVLVDRTKLSIQPATLNAAEWADLSRIAREKGVFLMEGAPGLLRSDNGFPSLFGYIPALTLSRVDALQPHHARCSKSYPVRGDWRRARTLRRPRR